MCVCGGIIEGGIIGIIFATLAFARKVWKKVKKNKNNEE